MKLPILRSVFSGSPAVQFPKALARPRRGRNRGQQILRLCLLAIQIFFAASAALAADEFLLPADNLVADGIPKIPAELSDHLRQYSEVRGARLTSWHPVDRRMLISTNFADTRQIHQLASPGGARTQLTFFKDAADEANYQPTKGDFFVFSKDNGGNEFYQQYAFDLASGKIILLTDGKSRNTGGAWSNAGDQYAYGSTRRTGKDVDLWIMNPADPKSDRLLAQMQGGGWSAMGFSPDDRSLLLLEVISANESYIWRLDVATGERTLLTPKDPQEPVANGHAEFSQDGQGIYLTTDRDSEFQRLAYLDLATNKYTYLTDTIKWDVEEFRLSWDGSTIAFTVNEDGMGTLHLLDTATRQERPVPKLPSGIVHGFEWHKNNDDLGFSFVSARTTSDVYSLNVPAGDLSRWTFSETGGINTESYADPELIHWPSFDGKSISGWLRQPPASFTGKRPVLIDIHGGPEGQARPLFESANNYLVHELGIAVIEPNIRGSSGYGKTFLKLDNGTLRTDSYKDIGALLDWIKTRPDLDADRVMVTGGSYGGHMTLAVASLYPDRIRCALDNCGPSNLVTFLEHTSGYRQDLRRVEYGDERDPKVREFLMRTAPMTNVAKITKPLFVVQGANDPRVPQSEAEQIVDALHASGTPVWYLLAKNEGHGYGNKTNRHFLLCATVLFIQQYLLN